MGRRFTEMRSKLMASLDKIGHRNGHTCPPTTDNKDPAMHEYLVSTDAEAFFKRRRDKAKKEMLSMLSDEDLDTINKAEKRVTKNMASEDITLMRGENYLLSCNVRTPIERFNQRRLRSELALKNWTQTEIDALINDCSELQTPAKSYKVLDATDH